jgi:TPR repeat protein
MRFAPKTVGGVPCRALLRRLPFFFAAVGILGIIPSVGMAQSGAVQTTQANQSAQQKTLSEEELKSLLQKAEQGDAQAQYNLGRMYEEGSGVSQDYAQAMAWWRKAADQGNPSAQCELGVTYWNGNWVPEDQVEALKWVSLAADQASVSAARGGLAVPGSAAWLRDVISQDMTPAQIAEAQTRASEWMAAFEKRKK